MITFNSRFSPSSKGSKKYKLRRKSRTGYFFAFSHDTLGYSVTRLRNRYILKTYPEMTKMQLQRWIHNGQSN